jgi:uncharacterized protein (TIGR03083 family)
MEQLIRAERLALIAFLETLDAEEWGTQSLCGAWTVQAVAAHIAWAPVAGPGQLLPELARARFRLNKASAQLATSWSQRGPEAILDQLRTNAAANARPRGVPPAAALVDAVVHAIDIQHPLGRTRPIPPEAFRPVADFAIGSRWPMNISTGGSARKRLDGIQLVAEGYNWSYGQGPQVQAAGDAVLRILNGRAVTREELAGQGADQLSARINP